MKYREFPEEDYPLWTAVLALIVVGLLIGFIVYKGVL